MQLLSGCPVRPTCIPVRSSHINGSPSFLKLHRHALQALVHPQPSLLPIEKPEAGIMETTGANAIAQENFDKNVAFLQAVQVGETPSSSSRPTGL